MKKHWNSYQNQASQQKAGFSSLALSVLLQAKKDSARMPNQLWAMAQAEFIRPKDGGLSDTAEQIAYFVSCFCLNGRLKCPECDVIINRLQIDIVIDGHIRRLFECPACDGIYYHEVSNDIEPGVRV